MRLIDADALIPMMKYATTDSEIGAFPIKIGFDAIVKVINAQPTIERKKGKWHREVLGSTSGYGTTVMYKCSNCESMAIIHHSFCPYCGADMRGGKR